MVAKSTKPISLDASWIEQRIYREGEKRIPRQAHKEVVPDHDQTIDFVRKDAMPVDESLIE